MTKLTLYKLTERYQAIETLLDSEIVEREEVLSTLATIKDEIEDKVENLAKLIIATNDTIGVIKSEEKRLYDRRQAMQNRMEWLKAYLVTEMVATHTYKVKRDVLTASVVDSPPSVEVNVMEEIPEQYVRVIPEQRDPDKKAIISHFKETGEIVSGVDIIINKKHLVIR